MQLLVTAQLKLSGDDLTSSFAPSTITVAPAASTFVANAQTIGTAAEALIVGDIGTAGYGAFKNADVTNFVVLSLASDGSAPFATLKPGQIAVLPLSTKVVYAKADTAPVILDYLITSA